MTVPQRKLGRPNTAKEAKYNHDLNIFADALIKFQEGVDFKISARGWCYQLETFNAIDKSQFDLAESKINECRKNGLLSIDFTASDTRRAAELIPTRDSNKDITLDEWKSGMFESINSHTPHLLSDQTSIYIEVLVEKVDLKGLFKPVCKEYQIPITNVSGWSDINSRAELIERCNRAYNNNKEVHLLYCGDFDPGGLIISETFIKNLKDLEDATGTNTDFIHFHRFGLNYEYIIDNNLVWTDNLKTGNKAKNALPLDNPKHKNHFDKHIQDYLKRYCNGGKKPRKVEANALLKNIPLARQLLQDAINKYINPIQLKNYKGSLIRSRLELKTAFSNLWDVS